MKRLKGKGKQKSDPYRDSGKDASKEGVSFASYDDLFGVKANSDAVDWSMFEDEFDTESVASNATRESKRSSKTSSSRFSFRKSLKSLTGKSEDPGETASVDEEDVDMMSGDSTSVVSKAYSQTSFEDVFGRRVFDEEELDSEFEFSNPSNWRDNTATKEAVYDVLSKGGSTMQKARKLFLLEQLNRPAPPSEAPNFWSRPGALGKNAARKTIKGFYEIPGLSGDGTGVNPEVFWSLVDIIGQASKLNLGWPIRVDFVLDTAKYLTRLHAANYTHGAVRSENILLDDNLRAYMKAAKSIAPLSKSEMYSDARENKVQLDILGLAIIIIELAQGKTLSNITCPKLRSAIKAEEKQRFEKLEEMEESVEKEVRSLLNAPGAGVPSSLIELCVQCCSPIRQNRPMAEDALDWLKDLRTDLQDHDTPSKGAVARVLVSNKKLALKPAKVFDFSTLPAFVDGDDGYETDDSYLPPDEQVVESKKPEPPRPVSNGNKLQAFLASTGNDPHLHSGAGSAASVSGDEKQRPRSMLLPTGLKTMFNEEETNTSAATTEDSKDSVKPKKLQRRRSLDRGYYYARSRFANQSEQDVKQLISKANIAKIKQEYMAKQHTISKKPVDPEALAKRLDEQEILSTEEAMAIILRADKIFREEPNLIKLNTTQQGNITVVGDIHGQYYDLRNLIRINGAPGKAKKGKTTYLFLGDYIDRGDWGCEVLFYLLALKAKFRENVWLLRGNHEARAVSSFFGFKDECVRKYGLPVYNRACEVFQAMPIAATVETPAGKFLALHGGISPNVQHLEQFIEFDRFAEPQMTGFLCDVLWSDPVKDSHEDGHEQSLSDFLSIDFLPNPQRGCSFRYGFRALVSFLAVNGLVGIIRAHEVQEEGYLYHFQDLSGSKADTAAQVTPPVITVFSAPNYCGRYGNKAAVIRIHNKPPGRKMKRTNGIRPIQLLEPVQFTAVAHPDPIQLESEQEKQTGRIESMCPYMPTTFASFIKKAIELGEEEAARDIRRDIARNKHTSLERNGGQMAPSPSHLQLQKKKMAPPLPPRKATEEPSAEEKPKKKNNWKAGQLLGFDDDTAQPDIPGKKDGKKKKKKANKKYTEAAAQDGINEMNPLVVEEKMKEAQNKLDPSGLHLPDKVRVQNGEKRRSLLKATPATRSQSPEPAADIAREGEGGTGDAITFTSSELVGLQTLFLFIDTKGRSYVTADDLVQWSAEEGSAVQKSEAELCINYVDVDMDGRIGFEDYLVFAAKCKDQWLVQQYGKVMSHIKRMQKQASSPKLV